MKLLIVDDEELTRTGVISSLDWSSLGIDKVIQADFTNRRSSCVMSACHAWTASPCWNVWKSFFRTVLPFL